LFHEFGIAAKNDQEQFSANDCFSLDIRYGLAPCMGDRNDTQQATE